MLYCLSYGANICALPFSIKMCNCMLNLYAFKFNYQNQYICLVARNDSKGFHRMQTHLILIFFEYSSKWIQLRAFIFTSSPTLSQMKRLLSKTWYGAIDKLYRITLTKSKWENLPYYAWNIKQTYQNKLRSK